MKKAYLIAAIIALTACTDNAPSEYDVYKYRTNTPPEEYIITNANKVLNNNRAFIAELLKTNKDSIIFIDAWLTFPISNIKDSVMYYNTNLSPIWVAYPYEYNSYTLEFFAHKPWWLTVDYKFNPILPDTISWQGWIYNK